MAKVKFIHTADLHIGKSRTLPDYLDRQAAMVEGIYKAAKDREINTVLMAGDIFESKNIRWDEQQMFIAKLFEYDMKGFTTVICNGNHDELAAGISHMWLPSLIAEHGGLNNTIIVDGCAQVVEVPEMSIGVIPVVNNNVTTAELASHVESLYEQSEASTTSGRPYIVMLHATITGSNTDTGYQITGGPSIPDTVGCVDYWAVGDIHACQEIGSNAWYSGSPMQHDFGDTLPKGVLEVLVTAGKPAKVGLISLDGIKPLVTVTESVLKEEGWPENCYIRYIGPLESIIELPDNVIKTEGVTHAPTSPEDIEEGDVAFTDSLIEGLADFLGNRGIPPDMQEEGIKWIAEKYGKHRL